MTPLVVELQQYETNFS